MEITNLLWHDIEVEHLKKMKPKDTMGFAQIVIEKDSITIFEFKKNHYSTGRMFLYGSPKVIKLTPYECEFEAEWWGTEFKKLKNGKTKIINLPSHKVKITAKF